MSPQTATSSTSEDFVKQKIRIDGLFLRLAAMYGHMWRSLFKSDEFLAFTKNEWLTGLMLFGDQIIDKALMHSRNHWEYPPTLPQFLECCKTQSKIGQVKSREINQAKPRPEIAYMHLEKMKMILNINPK